MLYASGWSCEHRVHNRPTYETCWSQNIIVTLTYRCIMLDICPACAVHAQPHGQMLAVFNGSSWQPTACAAGGAMVHRGWTTPPPIWAAAGHTTHPARHPAAPPASAARHWTATPAAAALAAAVAAPVATAASAASPAACRCYCRLLPGCKGPGWLHLHLACCRCCQRSLLPWDHQQHSRTGVGCHREGARRLHLAVQITISSRCHTFSI